MYTDEPGSISAERINNPGSAWHEAQRCLHGDRPEKAVTYLQRAVELDPKFTDAHYNLAVLYYQLGQLEAACREYEVILTLQPQDVDVLNNLGTIKASRGSLEEAKEMFDKALAIDAEFALTHRNLAAYYQRKGEIEKTAEHARRAKELDSKVFEREPGPPKL